jgi:hypothetical protein
VRLVQPVPSALVLDDLGEAGREGIGCRGGVVGGVGDAEAAAEIELAWPNWAMSRMVRRAATSKPCVSKIWEPMWEWMPRRSMRGELWHRTRAINAWPPLIEKPNF